MIGSEQTAAATKTPVKRIIIGSEQTASWSVILGSTDLVLEIVNHGGLVLNCGLNLSQYLAI